MGALLTAPRAVVADELRWCATCGAEIQSGEDAWLLARPLEDEVTDVKITIVCLASMEWRCAFCPRPRSWR